MIFHWINELQGSVVSIPNMEHRPEEVPLLHLERNGRREGPGQQAREASVAAAEGKATSIKTAIRQTDPDESQHVYLALLVDFYQSIVRGV